MVHHPISRCFVLKEKIQELVNVGVLTLKTEQKKVTENMVTLNFSTFPKMMVQDELTPVSKARLDVVNPMTEKQKAKGLVPITTKSGEVRWVHPDIIKMRNGNPASPSSMASHVTLSPLQWMMTL